MVTISKTAVEKLNEVMAEEGISPETHNLRVGVLGGGCKGFEWINPNASRTCGCGESFSL